MGGGVDDYPTQFNDKLNRVDKKSQELHKAVSHALDWIPNPTVRNAIISSWNWFVQKMEDLWNLLKEIVENMGSPGRLEDVANAWSKQVGGPVSSQSQNATAGAVMVDDTWTGTAADQYKEKLPLQASALAAVRTAISATVSTVLKDLRTAVIIFWGGLGTAILALVVGLVMATAATGTIIGAPAGVVAAVVAVVTAITAITVGTWNLESAASGANITLTSALNARESFQDGHWPTFAIA